MRLQGRLRLLQPLLVTGCKVRVLTKRLLSCANFQACFYTCEALYISYVLPTSLVFYILVSPGYLPIYICSFLEATWKLSQCWHVAEARVTFNILFLLSVNFEISYVPMGAPSSDEPALRYGTSAKTAPSTLRSSSRTPWHICRTSPKSSCCWGR